MTDTLALMEQAVTEGLMTCPGCGNSLEIDCPKCGGCGWENTILAEGWI
jgi:hypothetical protein